MTVSLIVHEILSLTLLYSCFCRAVRMTDATRTAILFAFWLLGVASVFSVFAPVVLPGWRPDPVSLSLLAAITVVQFTTSFYWRICTPDPFIKD